MEFFSSLHPVVQALLATLFTWGVTALGAALVLVRKDLSTRVLDSSFGFAAGVMLAASVWSLLVPALRLSAEPRWLPVALGFLSGGLCLRLVDLHQGSLLGAIGLAVGIGLQNFPEGMAVAFPLRREGYSPRECFFWGQLSGVVEPLAGVLGAALVLMVQPALPYLLAFAAGAMVFVVVEEVIPASQSNQHHDLATLSLMLGFTLMMVLDVALS